MSYAAPNISTHVAVTADLPEEKNELAVGRADLPVPSLYQQGVKVTHKVSGRPGIIARVDHPMCMMRLYYPDTQEFAPRTDWENFRDWQPEVTLSQEELARQATLLEYETELAKLDAQQLALASVLCEDADPARSLAKLRVMISSGLIKLPATEVTERAVASKRAKP